MKLCTENKKKKTPKKNINTLKFLCVPMNYSGLRNYVKTLMEFKICSESMFCYLVEGK